MVFVKGRHCQGLRHSSWSFLINVLKHVHLGFSDRWIEIVCALFFTASSRPL
jgi:hypothetical protein